MPNSAAVFSVGQQYLYNQLLNDSKKYMEEKIKEAPVSSQTIYTLQIPEALLESSLESIDRELEERASALSEISKLLEVVEGTDSLIREHLSNLRMAASRSERKRSKKPPQYSMLSVPEPAEVNSPQFGAGQSVAAAEWQVGLGSSVQGLE